MRGILFFSLFLSWILFVNAHGENRDEIPNGYFVPCPPGECLGTCAGVGHVNNDGKAGCLGGEHPFHANNQFGLDLQDIANFTWTRTMCLKDSDNDGFTNGDELGDPCCIWDKHSNPTPARVRGSLSHPGAPTSTLRGKFRSCALDGAPQVVLINKRATATSIWVNINTNGSCVCSTVYTVAIGSATPTTKVHVSQNNATEFGLTGLEPSTNYTVTISIKNIAGTSPLVFDIVTNAVSLTALAPPNITMVSRTSNSLILAWNPIINAISYEIEAKTNAGEMYLLYSGSNTTISINGLQSSTQYGYRVRSIDSNGVGNASEIFQFTTAAPAASSKPVAPSSTGSSPGSPESLAPLTPTEVKEGEYQHSTSLLGGNMIVYWTIEKSQSQINIALVAKTIGWVGIGFNPGAKGMTNTDMIMGRFYNGKLEIQDTYSYDEVTPSDDFIYGGKNDILEFSGIESSGRFTLKFRRLLNTSDEYDSAIFDEITTVVYAYGTDDHYSAGHSTSERGQFSVNFLSSDPVLTELQSPNDDIRLAHSVTMVLGWVFFSTIGILMARFGHQYNWWFPVHIVLMVIGMLLSLIGLILGIIASDNDFVQKDKVMLVHAWLGLLVVIGGLIQPFLGIIADRLYDPERTHIPVWPDKIHWYLGRYCLLGAIVNIFIGMIWWNVKVVYWVLFLVWMAIQVGVFHSLEYVKNKRKKKSQKVELSDKTQPKS